MALAGEPGAHGVTVLPYLDGERTPNRPDATGLLRGLTTGTSREDIARGLVEGLLCSLHDAVLALEAVTKVETKRIILIGGGSASEAVRTIAPQIFGVLVTVPEASEYVALGAARQALWALTGDAAAPNWPAPPSKTYSDEPRPEIFERYCQLRDDTEGW